MQLECVSHHLIQYMQRNCITEFECLLPKLDLFRYFSKIDISLDVRNVIA
jgi:hypothetical protein